MVSAPKVPPVPKPPPPPPSLGQPNIYRAGSFLQFQGKKSGMASTVVGGNNIFRRVGGTQPTAAGGRPF